MSVYSNESTEMMTLRYQLTLRFANRLKEGKIMLGRDMFSDEERDTILKAVAEYAIPSILSYATPMGVTFPFITSIQLSSLDQNTTYKHDITVTLTRHLDGREQRQGVSPLTVILESLEGVLFAGKLTDEYPELPMLAATIKMRQRAMPSAPIDTTWPYVETPSFGYGAPSWPSRESMFETPRFAVPVAQSSEPQASRVKVSTLNDPRLEVVRYLDGPVIAMVSEIDEDAFEPYLPLSNGSNTVLIVRSFAPNAAVAVLVMDDNISDAQVVMDQLYRRDPTVYVGLDTPNFVSQKLGKLDLVATPITVDDHVDKLRALAEEALGTKMPDGLKLLYRVEKAS